ncbi:MAG: hypothetical protein COT17_07830 [Elusimicrobia bacterium CG08_land_8_20_14_0_20_51_18]|nr:MAG: hypothetical protein COT17_07830 [Elusimicrobia bacterium CG08_land_8_20_14_0_20_51_18]
MTEKVLDFDSAVKVYKKPGFFKSRPSPALNGVSFSIEKAEIVGLLGLNGAGKTTIIKLVCGLIKANGGNIKIFGKSPDDLEVKGRIGYLPELPYFYPYLSPADALLYYGRLSGLSPETVKTAIPSILRKVGLEKHTNRRCAEFSKGMLQRLGIAQALLHNPEFLVMDEPVSGLDPIAIKDIRDLIISLNSEGKTIFLSSHSISELEKVCGRVIILSGGRIHSVVQREKWSDSGKSLEEIFVAAVTPDLN